MTPTIPVPFDYVRTGQVLVLGDGPELLVYSGSNDQGMWKLMCADVLMGVGATESHVLAVDYAGELTLYRMIDGQQQSRIATGCQPSGLEVAPGGESAVLTQDALVIVRFGGEPQRIELPGLRCVAWSADGSRLAAGCADGTLFLIEGATGEVVATTQVQGEVTTISWRPPGQWAVAVGDQIQVIELKVPPPTKAEPEPVAALSIVKALTAEAPILRLALSADGAVAAVQISPEMVHLIELINDQKIGEIEFQREIGGLGFGPAHWLAFGFDDGDANRLDVLTGKMTRTQAHAGRAQNAWAMNVRVNHAQVRGVVVGMAAGTTPIAKHNVPKIPKKRPKWLKWGIIAAVVLVLGLICCGMSGGIGMFVLW